MRRALKLAMFVAPMGIAPGCGAQSNLSEELENPTAVAAELDPVLASARGIEFRESDLAAFDEITPDVPVHLYADPERAEDLVRSRISMGLRRLVEIQEAESVGLDDSEEGQGLIDGAAREAGADWVEAQIGRDFEPTEEELRQEYEARENEFRGPGELWVYHIFLSLDGLSAEEEEAKRQLAQEIAEEAQANPNAFIPLAAEHSEAVGHGATSRLILNRPEQMHEEIREPLWSAGEGDIVGPIDSPAGLHVFQVTNHVSQTHSLESVRGYLTRILRTRFVESTHEELMNEAASRFGLTRRPAEEISRETVLVSGAETVTGADLERWGRADLAWRQPPERREELARATWREAVLLAHGRELGWDQDPRRLSEVEAACTEARVNGLWRIRAREEFGEVSEENMRAHHEANPRTRHRGLGLHVLDLRLDPAAFSEEGDTVAIMDVHRAAQRLHQRWASGELFEDLLAEVSGDTAAESSGSTLLVFPSGEDQLWHGTLAGLATGEVSPPVYNEDRSISLYQVIGVEHSLPIPFEDEAWRIHGQIQQARMRRLRGAWLSQLGQEIEWSLPQRVIQDVIAARVVAQEATPEEGSTEGSTTVLMEPPPLE